MRAIRFERFGDYPELKAALIPQPEPLPDELLVQISVAAVNPIDSTIRLGRFAGAKPPPLVPGTEAAGVVAAGSSDEIRVGARVLVRGGFGVTRDGTWEEFVAASPDQVLAAPRGLDDAGVAASGSGYLAAALALSRAGFAAGMSVLALGVGGAVGNATYQLARARGAARIVGTAGSTAKAHLARSRGFDDVVDLSAEAIEGTFDIVVDSIGGAMTGTALKMLADDGTLVAVGYVAGLTAEINLQDMVRRRGRIVAISLARMPAAAVKELYESMRAEFEDGRLKPLVARSFKLEEAAEAQRFLDQERPFGKVVLTL